MIKPPVHIVVIKPAGNPHAQAFAELAETLACGFQELGVAAVIRENAFDVAATSIVLGWHLLNEAQMAALPAGTVLYNLEQMDHQNRHLQTRLLAHAWRFPVWDYSRRNIEILRALGRNVPIRHVPIGYVPQLTRVPRAEVQDIDVLFYGSVNDRRRRILEALTEAGLEVRSVFGCYGRDRDALIARAKVVLNLHYYESSIFEMVRVSYLLANGKAVVAECLEDAEIDPKLKLAAALVPYEGLVEACCDLVQNERARLELEQRGLTYMESLPEREILRPVLLEDAPELEPLEAPAPPPEAAADGEDGRLKVAVFTFDGPATACWQIRMQGPFNFMAKEVEFRRAHVQKGEATRFAFPHVLEWADLFLVQRLFPCEETWPLLEKLIQRGKPLVYETDDLLISTPLGNPSRPSTERAAPWILKLIQNATALTVSTEEMKRTLAPYHSAIHVLPNLLDDELWLTPTLPVRPGEPLVIGFAGTPTHLLDLGFMGAALTRLQEKHGDRIRFVFMGCATEATKALPNFSFLPFKPNYRTYAQTLQEAGIHIGLAPLHDNFFNRCKSNIKWLEYAACGIAGVYSDLPPYRDVRAGETGLVAANTADAWFEALDRLVSEPGLREAIVAEARREVEARYSLSGAGRIYLDTLRALAGGEPRTADGACLPEGFRFDAVWDETRWVAVLLSYLHAFKPGEPVALLLPAVGAGAAGFTVEQIHQKILGIVASSGRTEFPDVVILDEPSEEEEILAGFSRVQALEMGPEGLGSLDGFFGWRLQEAYGQMMSPASPRPETPVEPPRAPGFSFSIEDAMGRPVPLVSVVIPAKNPGPKLAATLASIAQSRFPMNFLEVVVADDGSSDGAVDRLRSEDYPFPLTLIKGRALGQSAATNAAIRATRGLIVLSSAQDILFAPDLIQLHAARHAATSEEELVVLGNLPYPDGLPVTPFMCYLVNGGYQFAYFLIKDPENVPPSFLYAPNFSATRALLVRVGLFDDQFPYGSQDTDLGIRLQQAGARIVFEASAIGYHDHPVTLAQFCGRQEKVGPSLVRMHEKHPALKGLDGDLDRALLAYAGMPDLELRRLLREVARLEPLVAAAPADFQEVWRKAFILHQPPESFAPAERQLLPALGELFGCYQRILEYHLGQGWLTEAIRAWGVTQLEGLLSARMRVLQVPALIQRCADRRLAEHGLRLTGVPAAPGRMTVVIHGLASEETLAALLAPLYQTGFGLELFVAGCGAGLPHPPQVNRAFTAPTLDEAILTALSQVTTPCACVVSAEAAVALPQIQVAAGMVFKLPELGILAGDLGSGAGQPQAVEVPASECLIVRQEVLDDLLFDLEQVPEGAWNRRLADLARVKGLLVLGI